MDFDVACIGNYTKDTIVSPSGVRYVDGGAMNYAAHAVARLGLRAAVVTRLAAEDRERVVSMLEAQGITCLVTVTPQSTQMKLEYPTENVDVRNLYVASTAGSITADEVRGFGARAAAIGTSLRGEITMEAILALREKVELLAGDAQGFVRVLEGQDILYRPWEAMPDVLKHLDIFKTDVKEAEFLTGTTDKRKAAAQLAAYGPREVLLTHQDGLLTFANGRFYEASFHSRNLSGRSGRGDTCTGTYVAKRLTESPEEATRWAAALTSLKMEVHGPFRGSLAEVSQFVELRYR